MTGKEKLYFLLDAIKDATDIAPSGHPLLIDPTNNLNRKYNDVELSQLFTKLEKDEKVLRVLKVPVRIKFFHDEFDRYKQADDGCWHIELLPSFGGYFDKIQHEPEYFAFTGRKPTPTQNDESEINGWLAGKDERTLRRLWQVVRALNYEWQLRDRNSFQIPHEKFEREKITNVNDLEAILTSLHNKRFITVSRKIVEQPPSSDPSNKPGGMQIWQSILEDPHMTQLSDTQIQIIPDRFIYLRDTLKNKVNSESIKPTSPVESVTPSTSPQIAGYKLAYYPGDGIAEYRGTRYRFTGKAKALLSFLNGSKNTPWSLKEIQEKCNPNIAQTARHFKADKDTRDSVNYIRKMLKVKDGEYFPIEKRDTNWIWIEK